MPMWGGNPVNFTDPMGLQSSNPMRFFPTGGGLPDRSSDLLVCEAGQKKLELCEGKEGQALCECEYKLQLLACGVNFMCIMNAKRRLEACILGDGMPKGKG